MRATIGSAAVLAALLAAGCGTTKEAARPSAAGPDAPAAVEAARARPSVDEYRAADVRFFAAFQYPEAAEAEVYRTLDDAVRGADAVVLGRVTDVRVTRLVGGATDRLPMYGVTVVPQEVLRGSLPAAHAAAVTVEFVSAAASVEELRRALPNGFAVWVLRNKATLAPGVVPKRPVPTDERDYYRLVSSQALFVQGERHVVNPIEHVHEPEIPISGEASHGVERRDPVIVAAEGFPTLSSLAVHARGL